MMRKFKRKKSNSSPLTVGNLAYEIQQSSITSSPNWLCSLLADLDLANDHSHWIVQDCDLFWIGVGSGLGFLGSYYSCLLVFVFFSQVLLCNIISSFKEGKELDV